MRKIKIIEIDMKGRQETPQRQTGERNSVWISRGGHSTADHSS